MNSKFSPSPVVHRCLVAVAFLLLWFGSISFAPGRDRTLIDSGWRFQLGDPVDVTTNVTWYPEIADLAKVEPAQLTGTGSETYLQTIRVDIMATHAGENVSFVQTNYNDSAWRSLNLPHDWVVELPFRPERRWKPWLQDRRQLQLYHEQRRLVPSHLYDSLGLCRADALAGFRRGLSQLAGLAERPHSGPERQRVRQLLL